MFVRATDCAPCMVGTHGSATMLHLFLGLKSLVKVSRFHTDGSVFRLHYRITVMVLLAFTFIVTTRQYIGSPIMCVHTKDIPKDVLNTYCWIHPTYTLSSAHWKRVGIDVPHPGVDKTRDERDKKHVKYYQWVGFCLFFQVGSFKSNRPNKEAETGINCLIYVDHLRYQNNINSYKFWNQTKMILKLDLNKLTNFIFNLFSRILFKFYFCPWKYWITT